jgi:deoxyribodipyrimidine photo-lyase
MELSEQGSISFPTNYEAIVNRLALIDPIKYGASRNYINGTVSYLSPYISRGVISTKLVFEEILRRGHPTGRVQKLIQELAWRDYWQQVWIAKGDAINQDIKHEQSPVSNYSVARAIVYGKTGIKAIDSAVVKFYETGYLHNHVRMYIASIACNVGQSHWKVPAQWMHYHLLDADWASNALSWQWVAGSNANKKYIANQENINNYCFTDQKDTFLDVEYEDIPQLAVPEILKDTPPMDLTTPLPCSDKIIIDSSLPTLIYNFYNLDPLWKKDNSANRILLLEPSHFSQFPVSYKTIEFTLQLAKENIHEIQIFVGEFDELISAYDIKNNHYKEHPTNVNYTGIEEPRDWMFSVKGYYGSFFSFWKKCKKELVY